jgi:hypothetical protein
MIMPLLPEYVLMKHQPMAWIGMLPALYDRPSSQTTVNVVVPERSHAFLFVAGGVVALACVYAASRLPPLLK